MQSKTDKAKQFVKAGDIKSALKIVKDFDLIFNTLEIELFQIAYECMAGKQSFYQSIGADCESIKQKAELILKKWAE